LDILLSEQMFSAFKDVMGENFVFEQDSALAHIRHAVTVQHETLDCIYYSTTKL